MRTLLLGSLLQGVALLLYLMFDGLFSLYVISALFGLFQGGIVPMYAIIIREYFSPKEAGTRVGLVIMATVVGMALGGWLSGAIFDFTGSYQAAFLNGLGWNLVNVSIMTWLLLRSRRAPAFARAYGVGGQRIVVVDPGAGADRPIRRARGHGGVARNLLGAVRQMIARLVAGGDGLDARGARQPQGFVAPQRLRPFVAFAEHAGERRAVLDRLRRALRQERQHRMAGIAEQRDAADRPALSGARSNRPQTKVSSTAR